VSIKNLLFVLGLGTFAMFSCSSPEAKQKEIKIDQAKKDSVALIYDSTKADKQIDAFMQNLHKKSAFNGNVLVAKKGKILYQNSFGWADYLLKDSLNINSQFELASASKPITALGVMKLVQDYHSPTAFSSFGIAKLCLLFGGSMARPQETDVQSGCHELIDRKASKPLRSTRWQVPL